jgi:lipopolysaccharide cholinephosphotransferase
MSRNNYYFKHPYLTALPIVLYPAGEYGKQILTRLRSYGIEPIAFCDKNEDKIGATINGIVVQSLERLVEMYGADKLLFVVNSSANYPFIEKKLLQFRVPLKNILSPDIESYCDTGVIDRPIALNDYQIKKMQELLLELLLFIHNVCEKYGIKYSIFYGTLLGAVRHKGFIPWDNDADVAMLRADYNEFFRVVKREIGDRYGIIELTSRKAISIKGTKFRLFGDSKSYNIYLDVFPFDCVFECSSKIYRLQESLFLYLIKKSKKNKSDSNSECTGIGRMIKQLAIFVVSAFNKIDTGWIHYFVPDSRQFSSIVYSSNVFKTRMVIGFENYKFYASQMFDYILTMDYKDYMTPPSLEMRIPHALSELEFEQT